MQTTLMTNWYWINHNYQFFHLIYRQYEQVCCLLLVIIGALFISCPAAAAPTEFQEQLMLVDINRQQLNQTTRVLKDNAGILYLWSQDLQHWRLRLPDASTAIEYQNETYFPLSAILEITHTYDPRTLMLTIEVHPEAFIKTIRTTQYSNSPPPAQSGTGGFVNYDLYNQHSTDSTQTSGLFELGYFNHFGMGTSNILMNNLDISHNITRLDTTWTRDYPEKMQTLHLGDALTTPGTWGRSVRFGGLQWGTNFGTQPSFDTFPLQSAVGQAALPSTVDVFINNALVSSNNVPPGPFSIQNLPVITGQGNVKLVVRDLFGREQVITRPFYSSQSLLRVGLEDFSYELGLMRNNFGTSSYDYSNLLATGTYRRGLSERLTGEIHAETMKNETTVGVGDDLLIPSLGTLGTYVAGSQSKTGNGMMTLIEIDRLAEPWSFGVHTQWATRNFTQVGLQPPQLSPVQLSSVNLSYAMPSNGSVGIAYVVQNYRSQANMRIATLSYSTSLGKIGSFTLSALHTMTSDSNTTIFAMLSMSLDPATCLSSSWQSSRGENADNNFSTSLQHNLPLGEGYGYQLQARTDGYKEASYSFQNNIGTYTFDMSQKNESTASRLDISGGLAILGDTVLFSRRIDQSFAVVRIPDYPNVRVLADNQPAGRTDTQGNALIPQLRAYDINLISIDPHDIPLDAEIGTLKLQVIPTFRSGIEVNFPIKRSHGATFTVILENGQPLPVGTLIQKIESNEIFTVGYKGEVYINNLSSITQLRATWKNQTCKFTIQFIASSDPLPDLGTFLCKGITL